MFEHREPAKLWPAAAAIIVLLLLLATASSVTVGTFGILFYIPAVITSVYLAGVAIYVDFLHT